MRATAGGKVRFGMGGGAGVDGVLRFLTPDLEMEVGVDDGGPVDVVVAVDVDGFEALDDALEVEALEGVEDEARARDFRIGVEGSLVERVLRDDEEPERAVGENGEFLGEAPRRGLDGEDALEGEVNLAGNAGFPFGDFLTMDGDNGGSDERPNGLALGSDFLMAPGRDPKPEGFAFGDFLVGAMQGGKMLQGRRS